MSINPTFVSPTLAQTLSNRQVEKFTFASDTGEKASVMMSESDLMISGEVSCQRCQNMSKMLRH